MPKATVRCAELESLLRRKAQVLRAPPSGIGVSLDTKSKSLNPWRRTPQAPGFGHPELPDQCSDVALYRPHGHVERSAISLLDRRCAIGPVRRRSRWESSSIGFIQDNSQER
jgi:hypothetical protein